MMYLGNLELFNNEDTSALNRMDGTGRDDSAQEHPRRLRGVDIGCDDVEK